MAVDTAAKRFSMLDFDGPWSPAMGPPDGLDEFGGRSAGMWLYAGIEPDDPTPPTGGADTAEKRFNMIDWDQPFMPGMSPPDGTSTFGERLGMVWLYCGIEPGGLAPPPIGHRPGGFIVNVGRMMQR